MTHTVITFPDLDGKGATGSFGKRLAEIYPDASLVPILNGKDLEMLRGVARSLVRPFAPVVVRGQGLLAATLDGYEHIAQCYGEDTVVKLDTDEHPIDWIAPLARQAEKIGGFVVGDLEFSDPALLIENTPDWFAHIHVFPSLYGRATDNLLPISCAHGFQAFGPRVLPRVLKEIQRLLDKVEQYWGERPRFGLDGASALAAATVGIAVERVAVPGFKLRNRPASKVGEQTDAAVRMCLASRTHN